MILGQTTTSVGKIRRSFKKSATTKALLILRISSTVLKRVKLPVGRRLGYRVWFLTTNCQHLTLAVHFARRRSTTEP